MIKRLVTILFVIVIASLQLTYTAQRRAKKIVSLRSERKQMLDKLYLEKLFLEYDGSESSHTVISGLLNEKGTGSRAENQNVQGLANLAQGADRTIFEKNIRTIGSGNNLIEIADKSKRFFSYSYVYMKAKRICEIDIELEQLEKKEN